MSKKKTKKLKIRGHRQKLSSEARRYIDMKIKLIREEEPEKTMNQVLGKAYGMARQKGFNIPKLEKKLKGKRI